MVYQVYPKSFYDSNGDGMGDIKGITEKLSYLSELGIDVIWLCPVYKSPMADNGYDISDYRDIDPSFGSMEDIDKLIKRASEKGIKIIMDLVVNHTSDEHEWFKKSRLNKDNPYRDYYYWKKPKPDGGPPNNWRSVFGGSAWEYDDKTGEYYLHIFAKKQPDLNWENPAVRKEVRDMVNWWLNKGIAGFRVDAITYIKKNESFGDIPVSEWDGLASVSEMSLNQPGIHEFLDELSRETFSKFDIMTVAEAPGVPEEDIKKYIGPKGHFSMMFDFSYTDIDSVKDGMWYETREWSVSELNEKIARSQLLTEKAGWGAVYLENHDQPRSINKYIPEKDISLKSEKMLGGMYFFLRGTPFIYQGQELGMTNVEYDSIEEYDDIASKDQYDCALKNGLTAMDALKALHRISRDNSRTPMQWNDKENAGFSTGKPWLRVNPNYKKINAEKALKDKDSLFYFYKEMIRIRKESPYSEVLTYGSYSPVFKKGEDVVGYARILNDRKIAILANLGGKAVQLKLDSAVKKCILSNTEYKEGRDGVICMEPYDLLVLDLSK